MSSWSVCRSWEAPKPPNIGEPTATTRRILVVDDNRDSGKSLAMLLKPTGNETHTAHDGLEAAKSFRPDVILLDIGLPKLNGTKPAADLCTILVRGHGADIKSAATRSAMHSMNGRRRQSLWLNPTERKLA